MLSFDVLIAFLSPKQPEIEESYLESMQGVYPDRASGYTIGGHPDNIPPSHPDSGESAAIAPGYRHCIWNSATAHIPPGYSHPEF